MRVTREKAAENRANIIEAASRLFRERGIDGVGLDAVMAAAGLTHGGFYRHFRSKDDLAAAAIAYGQQLSAGRQDQAGTLHDLVGSYLTRAHIANPGEGCTVAALGTDVGRQGPELRAHFTTHFRRSITRVASLVRGRTEAARRQQALAVLAQLIGAVVLARAVDDPALVDEILAASRAAAGASAPGKIGGNVPFPPNPPSSV
jgi:TetR/AcrR family transcriptional repressor of nem operon